MSKQTIKGIDNKPTGAFVGFKRLVIFLLDSADRFNRWARNKRRAWRVKKLDEMNTEYGTALTQKDIWGDEI